MLRKMLLTAGCLGFGLGMAMMASADEIDDVIIDVLSSEHHAAEVARGNFDVTQQWVQITSWPMVFEEAMRGFVTFIPKRTAPACKDISFVQVAQVLDNHGQNYNWPSGESPRNEMRSAQGFFVDHEAVKCEMGKTCSPFYRDYWPNTEDGSRDGSVNSATQTPAILVDYPFGWSEIGSIKLEACAVCRGSGEVYGCFQWGGHWGLTTDRAYHPVKASNTPSNEWRQAVAKFQKYYGL